MKVLIIDTAPFITAHLEKIILRSLDNVSILSAQTYPIALQIIREQRPDIIIADIDLPENRIISLLGQTKLYGSSVDVIILSNYNDNCLIKKCIDLGVKCFVDKYYDFERIPELLLNIYDKSIKP